MPAPALEQARKTARSRARRRSKALEADLEIIYAKPVEEWDMEELARGRPRAANGTWVGKTPGWLTPAVRDEAQKRFISLARVDLQGELTACIKVVADLAKCEEVDERGNFIVPAGVRLSAATYVIDQILGKSTAKVEHDVTDKMGAFLAGAMVLDDGEDAHPVIEGSVVAASDDYDEDGE